MKILYLIAQYGRGAMSNQPHVELLAAWQALGADVQVLTLVNAGEQAGHESIDGIDVERLTLRTGWWERVLEIASQPIFHYRYLLTLVQRYHQAIARFKPDLVHVESAFPHGVAVALGQPTVPFALTLQGADVMNEPEFDYGYGRYTIVRKLLAYAFARAALVRGDSLQIRDLAVSLGCSPDKATAVPYNITAANYLQPDEELTTLRASARQIITERHGISLDAPLVLSLGRLHPFKGVEYLVRAVALIRQHVPETHVLVAGPARSTARFGDYAQYLRTLVPPDMINHVHFIGAVEHRLTRSYFAAADVMVVPSIAEAFNRVVVEAAAVGTPSIVTATTGVADYARAYQSAAIVPPRSAHAIAQALVPMLQNYTLWHLMSTRSLEFAEQFRPATIATTLLEQYMMVVGPPENA